MEEIQKGTIGNYLGYKIIEDNEVTEIRLPKKVIDLFKEGNFCKAEEFG